MGAADHLEIASTVVFDRGQTSGGEVTKVVRGVGWTLVIAGAVVLLYVVYLLWFTGLETDRAQSELAETFGSVDVDGSSPHPESDELPTLDPDDPQALDPDESRSDESVSDGSLEPGEAYAAIWFERDGERIVNDDVLYVVKGVSLDILRQGPGHYPESERPGGEGNVSIAGHRTTYGSPFWALNELTEGDTIHVVDRDGREWVYAYREQQVVAPTELWVIGEDPLGSGEPTITLTTCHPRGSAAQRLIAWGELVGDPIESTAGDPIDELAGT